MALTLIVGETEGESLAGVTRELLAAAARVQTPEAEVCLALADSDVSTALADATDIGVKRIYAMDHESLAGGAPGGFDAPVAALAALCGEVHPALVLFAKTDFGANVGPRLAFRLGVGFAQDCVDLVFDGGSGRVVVTRPVYGGNAMAVFRFGDRDPQIASIRPGAFDPAVSAGEPAEVVHLDVSGAIGEVRARLLETVAEEQAGTRLEDADVVVSGGRGLGGPEPFERLEELARTLKGAVGASRAACDAGWIDHSRQIGLTGKSISPRLYITFGISGASQHMAGCSGAKSIVAVNKDADANIFRQARFGVVGDWEKVFSGFMAAVQELDDA